MISTVIGVGAAVANAAEPYNNPVDGKAYIADWKTYLPADGVKAGSGRVVNSGVRLLNAQSEFEKNTTAADLAKLIGYIQEALTRHASQYKEGGEILLQIELSKNGKPNFKISFQGDLQQALLEKLYKSIGGIELNTKYSTVALQVHFSVKNA